MAKGNVGNLLQHFVGLRASSAFIELLKPNEHLTIEFIDAFSMAAWEQIVERNQATALFRRIVETFPDKVNEDDVVALTFSSGWSQFYDAMPIPPNPLDRVYPNTAVLLRLGFPDVRWKMRLHDVNSSNRDRLKAWAKTQDNLECCVEGQWDESPLICKSPVPAENAAIVMLDPNRIVPSNGPDSAKNSNLSDSNLRYMMAGLCLDLQKRPSRNANRPAMILAFSYSDSNPNTPNRIIEDLFRPHGWSITRVCSGPHRVYTNNAYHQGWVVCSSQQLLPDLQDLWDAWSQRPNDGAGAINS